MPSISSKITVVAFASAALLAGVINVNPASAIEISFTQTGFEEFTGSEPPGGILKVKLVGEDENTDDVLTQNELSSFFLSFTGNPVIPDFTQDISALGNLEFALLDTFAASNLIDITTKSTNVNGDTFEVGGNGSSTAVTYTISDGDSDPENDKKVFYQSSEEIQLVPEASTVAGLAGLVILSSLGFAKKKLLS